MSELKYPLFDLCYDEQEDKALLETLHSKWISMGPRCEEFQNLFQQKLQIKHAFATANCTAALHLAFKGLGIGPDDEVICPAYTFAATVNAITYTGATPVFCDVRSTKDINIDPEKMEELITTKTKAITIMHFAGFPCHIDEVLTLAKKHHLYVVEDACHGPLSEYHGKKLGTFGDVGCFSFFTNKNISTGEGGMVVTDNDALATHLRSLRSHGMTTMSYERAKGHATEYDIVEIGYNYRMDDIHAALGIVQTKKLPADIELRKNIRKKYLELMKNIPNVTIPFADWDGYVSNYIFPVVLENSTRVYRDTVRGKMLEHGVQTSVHYPAINKFSAYKQYYRELPVTEYLSDNELTLPMYAKLTEEDVANIVEVFKKAL